MKDRRKDITDKYTAAVNDAKKDRSTVSRTGKAAFASYSVEELKSIPKEAVENSFGCGNPASFIEVLPGQTVLDLGCGAGLDLLIAAEKVGPDGAVIGVDMTDAMLEMASETIQTSGFENIQVKKGYLEALPVPSNSIDWVISNCVVNLSAQKEQVFLEIARVLKPGGKILVADIVAEDLPWWLRHSGLLHAACAGGAISEADYREGLEDAGIRGFTVLARQYYEPSQMASIVLEGLPRAIRNIRCCGKSIASSVLTWIARGIADKLWSARIQAYKPL